MGTSIIGTCEAMCPKDEIQLWVENEIALNNYFIENRLQTNQREVVAFLWAQANRTRRLCCGWVKSRQRIRQISSRCSSTQTIPSSNKILSQKNGDVLADGHYRRWTKTIQCSLRLYLRSIACNSSRDCDARLWWMHNNWTDWTDDYVSGLFVVQVQWILFRFLWLNANSLGILLF